MICIKYMLWTLTQLSCPQTACIRFGILGELVEEGHVGTHSRAMVAAILKQTITLSTFLVKSQTYHYEEDSDHIKSM